MSAKLVDVKALYIILVLEILNINNLSSLLNQLYNLYEGIVDWLLIHDLDLL